AENGIRAFHVTGVQTCALPISSEPLRQRPHYLQRKMRRLADEEEKLLFRDRDELDIRQRRGGRAPRLVVDQCHLAEDRVGREVRSEERRVGRQWSAGGWSWLRV